VTIRRALIRPLPLGCLHLEGPLYMAGSCPPAVDTADELLTQQQVAEILQVTVATVRSRIDRNELRAYRVGPRAVRIRRSDLDHILTPIESGSANPATTVEAKRNNAGGRLESHIEKVLSQAPPLTDEQRTRLAELLRPARRRGGDAE
jgi:excisionase family DNA binding protein